MFWRLIDDKPRGAFFNMALDEAVSDAVRQKHSLPTLRLYQWENPSVTIGYFQNYSDINLNYCSKKSYPVVRRLTGGMAILHASELTYSFSAHSAVKPFGDSMISDYLSISNALVSALRFINIDAQVSLSRMKREIRNVPILRNPSCFNISSYGEVTVDGRKIIGSAQKRYNNGFLQQGSIMIDFDEDELDRVLHTYNPQINSCKTATIRKYLPLVSEDVIRKAIRNAFEETFNIRFICDIPTKCELAHAKKLVCEKYVTKEWNARR